MDKKPITDMDEVFEYLDQFFPSPIKDYEVNMDDLRARYKKSRTGTFDMMKGLVDQGLAKTRLAFNPEKRRKERVWWFEKDMEPEDTD